MCFLYLILYKLTRFRCAEYHTPQNHFRCVMVCYHKFLKRPSRPLCKIQSASVDTHTHTHTHFSTQPPKCPFNSKMATTWIKSHHQCFTLLDLLAVLSYQIFDTIFILGFGCWVICSSWTWKSWTFLWLISHFAVPSALSVCSYYHIAAVI